jgi:PEP-CTERM putative exosortase interaction domain
MKLTKTLRVLPALLALPAAASAATEILINDTFDANVSGWHFYRNTTGQAWYRSGTKVNPDDPTAGSMAATIDQALASEAHRQFEAVTLDMIGDSLTVSFDYRMTQAHSTGGLQVGFFDLGAPITANLFGPGTTSFVAGKTGYSFRTNTHATAPTASFVDNLNGNLTTGLSTVVIGDNAPHKISYTISLVAEGLLLSGMVDSVSIGSYTVADITSFTADTLRIHLPNVQGGAMYIDNVLVEFTAGSTIPEPAHASLLLGGLALAGFVLRRPRRG